MPTKGQGGEEHDPGSLDSSLMGDKDANTCSAFPQGFCEHQMKLCLPKKFVKGEMNTQY